MPALTREAARLPMRRLADIVSLGEAMTPIVPLPKLEDVIAGAVGASDRELGYNQSFVYPRLGIGELPRAMARELPEIELGRAPAHIDADGGLGRYSIVPYQSTHNTGGTILGTTRAVNLTVTGAATIVIANGAGLYAGQVVSLRGVAVSGGGSYTLAVQGGTLTINATDEEPEVMRNAANDAWVVIRKGTATIV